MKPLQIPTANPARFIQIVAALIAIQVPSLAAASSETPKRATAPNLATFTTGFEPNRGITDARVDYVAHGPRYTLFLTANEVLLGLAASKELPGATQAVRMKLVGANRHARHRGQDLQPGRSNYFIGSQAGWKTDVPHYARVEYSDVFPGITAVYHSTDQQLEYDFVVASGADPQTIRLAFEGTTRVRIDPNGDLVLETGAGEVRQRKPVLYQEVAGVRKPRPGGYVLRGRNEVGFETPEYDRNHPLVIDPVLQFSSYLGGAGNDVAYGLAVDPQGNVCIGGITASTNFPTTSPLQQTNRGNWDASSPRSAPRDR